MLLNGSTTCIARGTGRVAAAVSLFVIDTAVQAQICFELTDLQISVRVQHLELHPWYVRLQRMAA